MEIINIYADYQITCVQAAGGIHLTTESWANKPRIAPKTFSKAYCTGSIIKSVRAQDTDVRYMETNYSGHGNY
jgi:hypothetical protein